jgi:hypothetical protein
MFKQLMVVIAGLLLAWAATAVPTLAQTISEGL